MASSWNWGQFLWGLYAWGGGPLGTSASVTALAGMHRVSATALVSVEVSSVEVSSPMHTVSVLTGANADVISPMQTISVSVVVDAIATIEVTQPHSSISISGTDDVLVVVEVTSPMLIIDSILSENIDANVSVTPRMHYTTTLVYRGVLITVSVTSPMQTVEVVESVVPVSDLSITLPMDYITAIAEVSAALSFSTVVLNTENFANTNYDNFPFNSYCYFNGIYFGCTAAGVYSLGGDTDAGTDIDAEAKTSTFDTGKPSRVRIRKGFLTGRFKEITIEIYADEGDPYEHMIRADGNEVREAEVKFGRGHRERFFAWKIKNKKGEDFEIDSLTILGERKKEEPVRVR